MYIKHIKVFAIFLFIATPYITARAFFMAYAQRGYFSIGGEVFVPLLLYAAMFWLIEAASNAEKKARRRHAKQAR